MINKKNIDFLIKLQATFKIEAEEHIEKISSGLLELEKAKDRKNQLPVIEIIFRETHSLKGAARVVGKNDIEAICHWLESIFSLFKEKEVILIPEIFDQLHQATDIINVLVSEKKGLDISKILSQLTQLKKSCEDKIESTKITFPEKIKPPKKPKIIEPVKKEEPAESKLTTEEKHSPGETVRISSEKLSSFLIKAEEIVIAKEMLDQRSKDIENILEMLRQWKKEWSIIHPEILKITKSQIMIEKPLENTSLGIHIDKLNKFTSFNLNHIKLMENKLNTIYGLTRNENQTICAMVDDLINNIKSVLMLPFSFLLESFPKLVRDLSRESGKEVNLEIMGSEIEIDKRILDELKDPFIHILRNSIDHGMEIPQERIKRNKNSCGTIKIDISKIGNNKIRITIIDDGRGVDLQKIKEVVIKNKIVSKNEMIKMENKEILSLLFKSGISTSSLITDISGRGLGLAIARDKIERLKGSVFIDSTLNKGTSLIVTLPVTLASFRGVLVKVYDQTFAIPTTNIEKVLSINYQEIKTVENRETIPYEGRSLSFAHLADVLQLSSPPDSKKTAPSLPVIILRSKENMIAFGVDEILNEQESLFSSLGKQFSKVKNISGSIILGSGKIIPVLEATDLINSVKRASILGKPSISLMKEKITKEKKKAILVVEDSITARMLLKNIVESGGYQAMTAVDGLQAYEILKKEKIDLVVSDVDMPVMDGFELTSKIRNDESLSKIPLILVTALESSSDRERGMDVGADAYMVKSSFDQSNLLEVIKRFI